MMKVFILLAFVFALSWASSMDEIISRVNNQPTTWIAGVTKTSHLSIQQQKSLCGTRLRSISVESQEGPILGLPNEFDTATNWPGSRRPILKRINRLIYRLDSPISVTYFLTCVTSDNAHFAVAALGDRFFIASKGNIDKVLAPEDPVLCDGGGYLDGAWDYARTDGVVTESCMPYISGDGRDDMLCPSRCNNTAENFHKFHATSIRKPGTIWPLGRETHIMKEIMENGPVQTGFTVYQDFMAYSGGVYQHHTGQVLGGHAVVITGWGEENGTKYWKVANSWSEDWGEKGYFRIRRGHDECGMERQVIAGLAKL